MDEESVEIKVTSKMVGLDRFRWDAKDEGGEERCGPRTTKEGEREWQGH